MAKRMKAKDLTEGQRIIIKQSLYEITGKKVMNGRVVVTARTVGRTAPRVNTSKYSPDTYITVP